MTYRPAIDGVRAIAVIFVLLFHANVSAFSGGYIGVDVFFVISGYLITNLIYREHISGRFTLVGFYERRIRRILPAFFLVVLSTLAVGVLFLLPSDLTALGSSAVAATAFVSNFYFWTQGESYLLGRTEFMPLLHTWSLSIEEQFYVVFPVFTLLVLRLFKHRLGLIFLVVALSSFVLSAYLTSAHPRAAFFFSPARAWELLLGACIAIGGVKDLVSRQLKPMLQAAGLAMILGTTLIYDERTPFPGFAALVPCFGTALIIAWCNEDTRVIRGLSHPALVWCGLISYPLYLWHWPLLVLARMALLREPHGYEIAAIYCLSVVLAAATWHYVEKPVRARKGVISTRRIFALAAGGACVALVAGVSLRSAGELLRTPPPEVARILAAATDYAPGRWSCHNWDRKSAVPPFDCTIGDKTRTEFDFVLLGDSHAGALAVAVDDVARGAGRKGLQLTADNCPPLLGTKVIVRGEETDCERRNEAAFEFMRQYGIRHAVLAGRWVQYTGEWGEIIRPSARTNVVAEGAAVFQRALKETIQRFRDGGIDVNIIGPVPYIGWNVPTVVATMKWREWSPPEGPTLTDFMRTERNVVPFLRRLQGEGIGVVFPHEVLCRSTCLFQLNGDILYSDDEHLSTRGAGLLRPMLARELFRTGTEPEASGRLTPH